jgi:molybdopterin synthase sulfur carrier subunit
MSLKLVFIGRLEDIAGEAERQVESASSLDQLFAGLEPELASALRGDRIRLAVNGAVFTDRGAVSLQDGDELAFLPPVSGG